MFRFRFLRIFIPLVCIVPLPLTHAQVAGGALAADAAWEQLLAVSTWRSQTRTETPAELDWGSIAASARKFREDYPHHAKTRSSARIELTARIMSAEVDEKLSEEIAAEVVEYLNDKRNDARDRLLLKIDFDQAEIRRAKHASYELLLQARAAHARGLIRDFSDQSEGYGYLLSLARLAPSDQGGPLAEELLANRSTPSRFIPMARRIADRRTLLNQPLQLKGAEAALAKAAGKTLVIYSWRVRDDGLRTTLKEMGSLSDLAFIGINLDRDEASARQAALELPGTQFYEGEGLDGPLAKQLQLVLEMSMYVVDGQGVLRDIDAQRVPYEQLTSLLSARAGGGR